MKQILMATAIISVMMMTSCGSKKDKATDVNPFLTEWDTPFNVPPFEKIKNEHYIPAFEEGMKLQKEEIDIIIQSKEEPDFDNVIAALDYSGELLRNVSSVFFNMSSANTSDEIQEIAKEVSPMLTAHNDDILLNKDLFVKIEKVYNQKDELELSTEQMILLDLTYKNFVRSGAQLNDKQQQRLREINTELSTLTLQFGDNVLGDVNSWEMVIENAEDLAGLPEPLKETAAEAAKEKGYEGKWLFTLHTPSALPFLQFAENRDLRKKMQQGYVNRGNNNNEYDNKKIIEQIVALRYERAQLLGYDTHADFVLEMNMAENTETVFSLLDQIWSPALRLAFNEAKEYQKIIDSEGGNFKLEAWDWRYYAEKYRKLKYDLNEEELKPYFELTKVRDGIFYVCKQLYDIDFEMRDDIPVYHEDAVVYEVKNTDGSHVGLLYMDFHPRESKRSGAWMSSFRKQYRKDGKNITPVITIVCNFTKSTSTLPSLLTLDEVKTFYHEFGHALHGLLSNGTYYGLTGTSVPRDFVELPSQIMEHWALEPEVLKQYAFHHETGEVMPDELIAKIQNASYFDQGFATVEFVASAYLDMFYHTRTDKSFSDVNKFQNDVANEIRLLPEISFRHGSTHFQHIFSGGYSAGYYGYLWSGVLDSDAFEAFKENGIFDKATAESFRKNILEAGHSDKAMNLYKAFRGREPQIEPLLRKRGLI
jgi:peptidyl-dipeptidase Dcp